MGIILQDDWDVSNAACNFLEIIYIATKEYSSVNLSSHTYIRENPIFTNACAVIKINFFKF